VGPQGAPGESLATGATIFLRVGSPTPVGYTKAGTFTLKGTGRGKKAPSMTFDIYFKN
jgi:hypothetical protein